MFFMLYPYFTEQDDTLIRQGSVRDYLGLQTIWSTVARQLEPNLSGQVTNIQGIKAVGLIYYAHQLEKKTVSPWVG
jgi:hypothetical protein